MSCGYFCGKALNKQYCILRSLWVETPNLAVLQNFHLPNFSDKNVAISWRIYIIIIILYFACVRTSLSLLRGKCPYSGFFWSAFSHILTKYGNIFRISPYSAEYGHFLRSACDYAVSNCFSIFTPPRIWISLSIALYDTRVKRLIKNFIFIFYNSHMITNLIRQSEGIKQNWTGPRNFHIFFCVVFSCYDQSLISGRETGHEALLPTNFEIFLIFPSHSTNCEATIIQNVLH